MKKILTIFILAIGTFSNSYSQTTYGIDPLTACDSLTWTDGITYYVTNNTAKDTLVNAMGGDSIVTLDLAVNYSSAGTDVRVECDSLVWIDNNTYVTNNNVATHTITNTTGCDSLVTLNLTINNSTLSVDIISACDSLTWLDGNTYFTTNNTAKDTLTNAVGCDSIITLNLTINNSTTAIDNLASCDSLTWIDGNTYFTTNNTATHTIPNTVGCDSIITLNLTINNSTTAIDSINACDSITWIDGNTYFTTNNTATHTIPNTIGCDSIITLNLTINSSNTGMDNIAACDSLTWIDGNTYFTANNTATHIIANTNGCDSIITLNLTISASPIAIDNLAACDSLTWIDGNTYFTNNNTATHNIPSTIGCDSIITLNLTINISPTAIDSANTCDSFTWIDGNTYFTTNNTATHNIPNTIGCDSIIILNLTINNSTTAIDSITTCDSLTWIDGNTYYTTNNTVKDTLINAAGCDSIVTLNLIIYETPMVTIGVFGTDTVCINDSPIFLPNANPTGGSYSGNGVVGNMFDPAQAGIGFHMVYFSFGDSLVCLGADSTQITVESCGVGINENSSIGQVNIYPNPANDVINVSMNNGGQAVNFTLLSIDSKVVYQLNNVTDKTVAIDISKNSKGIYFLRIATNDNSKVYKVIKQ
jgi:hypothetical protein